MVLAVVHIVGALVATFAFGIFVLLMGERDKERIRRRRLEDISMALGVPVASLETDESLAPRLVQYWSQRFSRELLRNRVSDLCGALWTVWGWLSTLLQAILIVVVGWLMYAYGPQSAVLMWCVLAIAVFFWVVSVAFSLACLLFTGRFPGEAKAGRLALAPFLGQQKP